MGRPTKLTPELMDTIVQYIRNGNYITVAAQVAGIPERTYYRWMEKADDPNSDEIYRQFRQAVENARAFAEARNVMLIQKAADEGTWQAAAWYLERSAYKRWGRRTMVTGEDGEPIRVQVDHRESLRKMLGLDDADSGD